MTYCHGYENHVHVKNHGGILILKMATNAVNELGLGLSFNYAVRNKTEI